MEIESHPKAEGFYSCYKCGTVRSAYKNHFGKHLLILIIAFCVFNAGTGATTHSFSHRKIYFLHVRAHMYIFISH